MCVCVCVCVHDVCPWNRSLFPNDTAAWYFHQTAIRVAYGEPCPTLKCGFRLYSTTSDYAQKFSFSLHFGNLPHSPHVYVNRYTHVVIIYGAAFRECPECLQRLATHTHTHTHTHRNKQTNTLQKHALLVMGW